MRQGFAKHIKRRIAKRRLSNVLQWFGVPSPGFYWKWTGTLNIQYTWFGPKSEPCVAPRRHHWCAPRILWFMIHMTMIGNAGGVRVAHSHLMRAGAMAEALAPAVANEGDRRHTVRPPTFPRARKRAYMRALDRASANTNGGTWYRGRFLTLQQLQGHQRQSAPSRSQRDEGAPAADVSRLRVVVWNCGGLHAERFQEILAWLHEQEISRNNLSTS